MIKKTWSREDEKKNEKRSKKYLSIQNEQKKKRNTKFLFILY